MVRKVDNVWRLSASCPGGFFADSASVSATIVIGGRSPGTETLVC